VAGVRSARVGDGLSEGELKQPKALIKTPSGFLLVIQIFLEETAGELAGIFFHPRFVVSRQPSFFRALCSLAAYYCPSRNHGHTISYNRGPYTFYKGGPLTFYSSGPFIFYNRCTFTFYYRGPIAFYHSVVPSRSTIVSCTFTVSNRRPFTFYNRGLDTSYHSGNFAFHDASLFSFYTLNLKASSSTSCVPRFTAKQTKGGAWHGVLNLG